MQGQRILMVGLDLDDFEVMREGLALLVAETEDADVSRDAWHLLSRVGVLSDPGYAPFQYDD